MTRNPYAAEQFLAETVSLHSNAKMERAGDPDGLGVVRTFSFDKTTSKTLAKVLPEIDDERIVDYTEKDGRAIVTFSHRVVADRRAPFHLDAAKTVAESRSGVDG